MAPALVTFNNVHDIYLQKNLILKGMTWFEKGKVYALIEKVYLCIHFASKLFHFKAKNFLIQSIWLDTVKWESRKEVGCCRGKVNQPIDPTPKNLFKTIVVLVIYPNSNRLDLFI